MTGWVVVGLIVALLLGFALGALTKHAACYGEGVLDGQHQGELTHGEWHPADLGGSWNTPDRPRRKRSPDHQLVTRSMPPSASVLHHP